MRTRGRGSKNPEILRMSLIKCACATRWVATEGEVYDVNYAVKLRDMQINELEMEVSDMRGKFIIPKLKKVHNFKLMGGEE